MKPLYQERHSSQEIGEWKANELYVQVLAHVPLLDTETEQAGKDASNYPTRISLWWNRFRCC